MYAEFADEDEKIAAKVEQSKKLLKPIA